MKFLVDTHLLLWTVLQPSNLSQAAQKILRDVHNELLFSAASVWELAIKNTRAQSNFYVDLSVLRTTLSAISFKELAVRSEHAVAIERLPHFHKDPFDRILIAQAMVEGCVLLTSDALVARYPGPIQRV